MNTAKISSYNKLIAFFLIIVALLSVLVVSANGWQDNDDPFWNNDNDAANNKDDGADEPPEEMQTTTPGPEAPKFYHHITGEEITEENSGISQVAYILDGDSPLCGIYNCNVLIEFPIENGKTRYFMLSDINAPLEKIGSITYSRDFISNLAYSFGATIVSLGNDDNVEYNHVDTSEYTVHLNKNPDAYYTEYTYFAYTSTQLITKTILSSARIQSTIPYSFKNNQTPSGTINAKTLNIPYETSTTLVYSQERNKYCLCKMGSDKIDVSTSSNVMFTNALVLYADSMTYETAENTQIVINTLGSGSGYYAYSGMAEKITWIMDAEGNLSLFDQNGEKLQIGQGNTYIAYVKSSKSNVSIFQ
jgi:hypothetical protein